MDLTHISSQVSGPWKRWTPGKQSLPNTIMKGLSKHIHSFIYTFNQSINQSINQSLECQLQEAGVQSHFHLHLQYLNKYLSIHPANKCYLPGLWQPLCQVLLNTSVQVRHLSVLPLWSYSLLESQMNKHICDYNM